MDLMVLPHGGQLRELSKTVNYLAQNLASNKLMVNGNRVYCYLAAGSGQPFTSVGLRFLTRKPARRGGDRTTGCWKIPSRSGILWLCVHVIGEGARGTWYRALNYVLSWNS